MSETTHTVNLTPAFVVWSVVWGIPALLLHSKALAVVAVFPWVLMVGFMLVFVLVGVVALLVTWFSGRPLTLTNNATGTTRTIQRRKR